MASEQQRNSAASAANARVRNMFSRAIIARGGESAEVSREGNQENGLTGDAPVLYLTYRLNTNDG